MHPSASEPSASEPSASESSADSAEPTGPLAGIRVLDLGFVYAAPIAGMLLGDYGADVIKVEHPHGDPARTHGFTKDGHGLWSKVIGRNKRTVTLDLNKEDAREILRRMVVSADVLIENFRPGVLEGWGIGPEDLQKINPGLIVLRVTGFGQTGPYATRRAFGTLAEAMSTFAHQTGDENGPPTLAPFGLADGVAGVTGAFAVMLALYHRDVRGGQGQVIDISLLEPLLGILGPGPTAYDQLGVVPGRHGNRSPNNAPRNAYLTKDGRWVAISASATSIAARVMTLVGHPELVDEPWFDSASERVKHADLLDAPVAVWVREREFDEVMEQFQAAGAAMAPIYDIGQLMHDPHIVERETVVSVEDEDLGAIRMQNVFARLSGTPGTIRYPGRRKGRDTDEVFRELLGLDAGQVEALREQGII